jgi:hypothetical protein
MLCLGYAMKIAKSPTSREYSAMRQMITADPSVRGFSLYSAKQYPAALRAENIETDSIDSVINREFPAAAACVDAGHFGEARGLLLDLEYCFVSDSITALRRSLDGE